MTIEIVPYNEEWPDLFKTIVRQIQDAFEGQALGIHHIGSTSVPGLSAKDVIDIQVTVPELNDTWQQSLGLIGFQKLSHITNDHYPPGREDMLIEQLTKQFFKKDDPAINLHIRKKGYFNQRYPLLCRDYLRANPHAASAYEAVKKNLAHYFPDNMDAYYDIKDPVFDIIMSGAEIWADTTNWQPNFTDL